MPGLVLALMIIAVSAGGFAYAAASGSDDEMQDRDRIVAEYIANNPNAVLEIPFTEAQMKEAEIRKDITISKIHKVVSKGDLLQVQVNGSIVNAPPYRSVNEGQVMVPLRWSADILGWFITQILESSGYGIIDGDNSLMDSKYYIDLDGDGQNETVQIMANIDESKWELIVLGDGSETAVEIFPRDNKGFGASTIYAGHIIGHDSMDFLLATDYRSMPFGGCGYELYSLKDGAFNQIDLSNITKGTPFTIKVHENQQTAQITANHAVTVVPLSDWELQGYKQYGDEFCQNFFIEMILQNAPGEQLPELVSTEVIAATLPHHLTYLHTTYRYVDGAWKTGKTAFSDLP